MEDVSSSYKASCSLSKSGSSSYDKLRCKSSSLLCCRWISFSKYFIIARRLTGFLCFARNSFDQWRHARANKSLDYELGCVPGRKGGVCVTLIVEWWFVGDDIQKRRKCRIKRFEARCYSKLSARLFRTKSFLRRLASLLLQKRKIVILSLKIRPSVIKHITSL